MLIGYNDKIFEVDKDVATIFSNDHYEPPGIFCTVIHEKGGARAENFRTVGSEPKCPPILQALHKTLQARRIPATIPQVRDLEMKFNNDLEDRSSDIDFNVLTMSELDFVGDFVYLTHGGLYLTTPERIKRGFDEGLIGEYQLDGLYLCQSLIRLTKEEAITLVESKIGTRIMSYREFSEETKEGDIMEPHTIKMERSLLTSLPKYDIPLKEVAKDPRIIMSSDGRRRAELYSEYYFGNKSKVSPYKHKWDIHNWDELKKADALGVLLYNYLDLWGDMNNHHASFLGIASH